MKITIENCPANVSARELARAVEKSTAGAHSAAITVETSTGTVSGKFTRTGQNAAVFVCNGVAPAPAKVAAKNNQDILSLALESGKVTRSGSWYFFNDKKYLGKKHIIAALQK